MARLARAFECALAVDGWPGDRVRAPGERFSLDSFRRAIGTAIAFYHEVSRL